MIGDTLPPDTSSLLSSLGVPGLVFIVIILSGVIIYLFKRLEVVQNKVDSQYEQRIADGKELTSKITEPLANIANRAEQDSKVTQAIYDILQFSNRRKK